MSSGSSTTILVIEDESLVRRVVTSILRKNGYTVLEAENGTKALALVDIHEGPIHLLIVDYALPQMTGPQLARSILSKRTETAVLYMSGYTEDQLARQGALEPGSSFIEKALVWKDLAGRVKQILDPGAASADASRRVSF